MAVSLRGTTQGVYRSSGSGTVAWPSGTVAGDLAVLALLEDKDGKPDSKPLVDGWTLRQSGPSTTLWDKRLTSADIAAALPFRGYVDMLSTFSGAGKVGNVTNTNGAKLTVAGAGLFGFCRADEDGATLTPSTGKLHTSDIINASYRNRRHNTWFIAYATTGYKSISTNADYMTCAEILPLAGPAAPTLNEPLASQQLDPADVQTFSWLHNSDQGVPQDEFKLRMRQVSTSTWYYVTTGGTLSTTELGIATVDTFDTLNASQLTTALTYEWQVATKDSGTWGPYSTSRQFTTAAKPTVSSISVSSPADDLTPTITWTNTAGLGSIVAHRVYLKDSSSGAVVYDSGNRSGAGGSLTAPGDTAWTNGQTLRAHVMIRQTGGLWSTITAAAGTFSVSWTAPTTPTAVTAANQLDNPLQVTVTGLNVAYAKLQVQQSTDGQVTWQQIAATTPTATSMTFDLPMAVYGVAGRYRARQGTLIDGQLMWSAWATSGADVASTDTGAYLLSADTTEWLRVRYRQDDAQTLVEAMTITYGLSATRADVHRTPTAGWTGRTTFAGRTKAERAALISFLQRNPSFIIRWSPEIEVGAGLADVGSILVQRISPLTVERIAQYVTALRDLPVDWVEA